MLWKISNKQTTKKRVSCYNQLNNTFSNKRIPYIKILQILAILCLSWLSSSVRNKKIVHTIASLEIKR